MSNHSHHDGEIVSPMEVIEEFWPIMIFGTLFLLMCYLPLLALESKMWFFGAVIGTLVLVTALISPVLLHACCKNK